MDIIIQISLNCVKFSLKSRLDMKREITIVTSNNTYAYNLRNKLQSVGFSVDYISNINEFIEWLRIANSKIILVEVSEIGIVDQLNSCRENINKNLLIYLDDNNLLYTHSYRSSNLISNLESIVSLLPELEKIYNDRFNDTWVFTRNLSDILVRFGISPKYKGFSYLIDCIEYGLRKNHKSIRYSSEIYPKIARIYKVSSSTIEKSIRVAINKACDKFPDLYNNPSCFSASHVTNNEFMNFIIDKIKQYK